MGELEQSLNASMTDVLEITEESIGKGEATEADVRFAIRMICAEYKSQCQMGSISKEQIDLTYDLAEIVSRVIKQSEKLGWSEAYVHITKVKEDFIAEGRGSFKVPSMGSDVIMAQHPDEIDPNYGAFSSVSWMQKKILSVLKEKAPDEDLTIDDQYVLYQKLRTVLTRRQNNAADTTAHPIGIELEELLKDKLREYERTENVTTFEQVQACEYIQTWARWYIFQD